MPTLAGGALAPLLNAVVFNADAVRANLSQDLGFSHTDRTEHARRMGWLCDRVVEAGGTTIADFICPTEETRAEGSPQYWAEQALMRLRPPFDPQRPTALFVGRYQPFHRGHQRLIEEGLRRVGQACIAVRDTHGINERKIRGRFLL